VRTGAKIGGASAVGGALPGLGSAAASRNSEATKPIQWDYNYHSPGGVLIDKAAQFIGANLSDIRGATFDPTTGQLCFLGTENAGATKDVNMDYFFTAIQAVYGSFTPPFVTLDPPVTQINEWTDFGDGDGLFEPKEWGGFTLRYNPIWADQDNYVDVRVIATMNGNPQTTSIRLNAKRTDGPIVLLAGDRYGMRLEFGTETGSLPGVTFDRSDFSAGRLHQSFKLTQTSQDSYWPVFFYNNGPNQFIITDVRVIPGKQHRRYGGRLEGSRLGWVLYEADRVMKCLSVGKDNLTGATYSSATVPIVGYKNMIERLKSGGRSGFSRMWFVPNEMDLKRHVDPVTGRASVVFDKSSVSLLTEAFLSGIPATGEASAFATHFTANYDAFAARTFPVQDPTDPTGGRIIQVKIFEMLEEAMQAVAIARFFRDNEIPLDTWWLNQWQPPAAYTPKSVATAYNSDTASGIEYVTYGGVQVQKPNAYIPSSVAKSVADTILSGRPVDATKPTEDLKATTWTTNTSQGQLRAVAASLQAEQQDGNIDFAEVYHAFASPGIPLTVGAYYRSSWLGKEQLGPGWGSLRYRLEFSHPSIYDEGEYTNLDKTLSGDTQLRRGEVRLVDLANGSSIEFNSSLVWNYSVSNLGNPQNAITGLNALSVPTFTPGVRRDGSKLVQTEEKTYEATTPKGDVLTFDSNGRLLGIKTRHGHEHVYDYDYTTGRLLTVTDGIGQVLTYNYDASGMLSNVTGPNAIAIHFVYDSSKRLIQAVRKPGDHIIRTYTYNTSNQLQTVTDMHGVRRLNTTPDERGRTDQEVDTRGNTTEMRFFREALAAGKTVNTVKSKDVASNLGETSTTSDMEGRVMSNTNIYGNTVSLGYTGTSISPTSIKLPTPNRPEITVARNSNDLPTSIHDPAVTGASPVAITYNALNLPTRIVDEVKRTTAMAYSAQGDLTAMTQYLGNTPVTSRIEYSNGFMTGQIDPLGNKTTIQRDPFGRVLSVTDPTGVIIRYEYDVQGRLIKTFDPRLSSAIIYTYDNLDRVLTVTTPSGTTTYQYDAVKKWLNTVTDPLNRSVTNTYNNTTGDVTKTSIRLTSTTTLDTAFAYNRVGGLQSVTPPGGQPIGFNFDDGGLLTGTYETAASILGPPLNLKSNRARDGVQTTERSHTFTWSAPYSASPVNGYSYALDAIPDNTAEATGATVTYPNVALGNHIFRVKARDTSGRWGEVASFRLVVVNSLTSGGSQVIAPNAIDLGTIVNTYESYFVPDLSTNVNITKIGDVVWYKFTLPANLNPSTRNFLDIATVPSGASSTFPGDDSEIGLYASDGSLIADDDDDSVGGYGQLSFGNALPSFSSRGPLGEIGFAAGSEAEGNDGPLSAGTYYLAVGGYNTSFGIRGFDVSSSSSALGSFDLEFRTDIPYRNPVLSVKRPRKVPATKTRAIVQGRCFDPDGGTFDVFIKVGKAPARRISSAPSWRVSVPVKPGRNIVDVFAIDQNGLRSQSQRVVIVREMRSKG
jgi:YD repeat-containing protein